MKKNSLAGLPLQRQAPLALLFAPFILRLLPCSNAFWFDEIWSWQISRVVTSPLQILTNPLAQTDNNHPLNTLWMYLIGNTSSWWIYRLPAMLAGCAMVLLILWMERKIFRWSALVVCLLIGLSFPLITYSSEARGYAPMLLCAVAGYYLLRSEKLIVQIAFAAICCVGLLCHLTFIHFLLAAIISGLVQRRPRKLWVFVPSLVLLVFYVWIFVRHIQIGGAPDASIVATVAGTLSLMLGGPRGGVAIYFVAAMVLACIIRGLMWMRRRSGPEALFFLLVIFVAPLITILLQDLSPNHAPSIQVRYLLVPFTFSLILLVRYFAAHLQQRSANRAIFIAILALATLGNGYHLGRFFAVGRGDYLGALQYMAANSPTPSITWSCVDSGNAFRTGKILSYYQELLPTRPFLQSSEPQWLVYNVDNLPDSYPPIRLGNSIYHFDSSYPAYGLSGWSWVLYSNTAR
jgi:hypothetical protein